MVQPNGFNIHAVTTALCVRAEKVDGSNCTMMDTHLGFANMILEYITILRLFLGSKKEMLAKFANLTKYLGNLH